MKNAIFIFVFILTAVYAAFAQTNKVLDAPILNGMADSLPKPDYPPEARDLCAEGVVSIKVEIDENGLVSFAEIASGDPLLRDAALAAVKKAKFRKTNYGGRPIKVEGFVVYNFVPEKKCLDAGIVNKKAIRLPKPQIASGVKIKREMTVQVLVVIDERGSVVSARILRDIHPLLRASFETAARQAKFYPTNDVGRIRVKAYLVYKIKPNGKVGT